MRRGVRPIEITVRRQVHASPEVVYGLVSDVTRMAEWSPETVQCCWLDGADRAQVGARFRGRNRLGRLSWSTSPTVIHADRGRRFAFRVPGASGTTWTYTFEDAEGGTQVTEHAHQDRPSPAPIRFLQARAGVSDRTEHLRQGMIETLDRLARVAGGTPATQPAVRTR